MADRPADTREVPDGYELVAVEEGPDWRIDTARPCRRGFGPHHPFCRQPSIVATTRGERRQWWAYCPLHSYGRWVEDGKVMHWILREQETPHG